MNCEKITKISIPSTVEKIIIPKSVLKVYSYAFAYCDKLTIYCQIETQSKRGILIGIIQNVLLFVDIPNNSISKELTLS